MEAQAAAEPVTLRGAFGGEIKAEIRGRVLIALREAWHKQERFYVPVERVSLGRPGGEEWNRAMALLARLEVTPLYKQGNFDAAYEKCLAVSEHDKRLAEDTMADIAHRHAMWNHMQRG